MNNPTQEKQVAFTNPSYDQTQPTKVRVGDFLGAYHLILNGVQPHERFDLRNEGNPNEYCDTGDKEYFINFVELLVNQAKLEERKLVLSEIGEDEVCNLPQTEENVDAYKRVTSRNYLRIELRQKTLKRIEFLEKQ